MFSMTLLGILALSFFGAPANAAVNPVGIPLENQLLPFVSDGCSRFPDGNPTGNDTLWRHCCVLHDVFYWKGGTADDREHADLFLRDCVSKAAGRAIGDAMYLGVRAGGAAGLPTSWRWGYGWLLDRGYAPLNASEKAQVENLAKDISADPSRVPIVSSPTLAQRQTLTGDYCLDLAVVRIEATLGQSFKISDLKRETRRRMNGKGYLSTLEITTEELPSVLFKFSFALSDESSCDASDAPINELVARSRVRLLRAELPPLPR